MRLVVFFLGRIGAGPRYAFEMTKALAMLDNNISLQIVLPDNIDNIADWNSLDKNYGNVELSLVKTYSDKWSFFKSFFNIKNQKHIANLIKGFEPDAIYVPMGGLLHPLVFRYLKQYFVINTLHDPKSHVGEESFFVEFLRKVEVKQCNRLVLLNHFYIDQVVEDFNILKENLCIIPHAAFFSKENIVKAQYFTYKILFIGRIEKYKGIDLLLNAMQTITGINENINCTIAGSGSLSSYVNDIEKLGNRVCVLNKWLSDSEIDSLISGHDFVVLPYIDASQSGVIPLVFGNGKTVIATNVGALREQVPESIGLLVNPDSNELSEAILKLYQKGIVSLNEKNIRAKKYAKDHLTWESSAKKIVSLLLKNNN
jgi:glycosyltransferase involved in cell wall biosynthesis